MFYSGGVYLIVLENSHLKVVLDPELGGKIVSFINKGKNFELAAQNKHEVTLDKAPGKCFGRYAYGMDDAFPNLISEVVDCDCGRLVYPDHGEIWSAKFDVSGTAREFVSLKWNSEKFGYQYRKIMTLDKTGLSISYRITNTAKRELPCYWTWHGLVRFEENMRVLWPHGTKGFINAQDGGLLGSAGKRYDITNGFYDFTGVPETRTMYTAKFFVEGAVPEGRCGIYYPSHDVTYYLEFDSSTLPFLGFWVTAGGFQGDYNCALEPTNGSCDSVSKSLQSGWRAKLMPGESKVFALRLSLV